jgi:hypothetical protein
VDISATSVNVLRFTANMQIESSKLEEKQEDIDAEASIDPQIIESKGK